MCDRKIHDGYWPTQPRERKLVHQEQRGNRISQVRNLLIHAANCISWCKINNMKAYPSEFQVIQANSKTNDFSITVDGTCIQAEPQVKLLGVYVDSRLTFYAKLLE